MFNWYVRLLSGRPLVVLAVVAALAAVCAVLAGLYGHSPDFSDPAAGFVTRGTPAHGAHVAWINLLESTGVGNEPGKPLSTYPLSAARPTSQGDAWPAGRTRRSATGTHSLPPGISTEDGVPEGGRCDTTPDGQYARLVLAVPNSKGSGLFTVEAIHSMCSYASQIRTLPSYAALLPVGVDAGADCDFISLGTYVALLTKASNCSDIDANDVNDFVSLIDDCVSWYKLYSLKADCWTAATDYSHIFAARAFCPTDMPMRCRRTEVFNVFHYIIDSESYASSNRPRPEHAMMFLPVIESERLIDLYDSLRDLDAHKDAEVKVVAAEFGLKHLVFRRVMWQDMIWIGLAAMLVFLLLFIFTGSLFITLMSAIGMVISLALSYCLYQLVFGISFFPFVNLLTIVIVIGIGADNLLIFAKAWHSIKESKDTHVLEMIVCMTLKSAGASTLVTSLTTAAAFYAGSFSDVVALRCFCIYAGTTVLSCYLVSVTWLLACFVTLEKWSLSRSCPSGLLSDRVLRLRGVASGLRAALAVRDPYRKLWWVWIALLTAAGVCGLVGLFYWPQFCLPSTNVFTLLPSEHPFEVYDATMRNRFDFESVAARLVPLYFVWGVSHVFSGDFYDLNSNGRLIFSQGFDVSSEESQAWLMETFCQGLRDSGLVDGKPQQSECFIEDLVVYLEQQTCNSRYAMPPCCFQSGEQRSFPYEPRFFRECLSVWSSVTNKYHLSKQYDPGVRFFTSNGSLAALVVRFFADSNRSTVSSSSSGAHLDRHYYSELEAWLDERLSSAPEPMRGAFLVSNPDQLFYDLQRSVQRSVPRSLLISACITVVLIFVCTLNPLLLAFSIVGIAWAVSVTLASLLLLGWQLGILESVIISLAIGLSMDYSLHYVIAYRMYSSGGAGDKAASSAQQRATGAIRAVGDSLCYAALTTFVAGACILPASVLAYRQLGVFLTIMSAVSWVYATTYLPPLLSLAGPGGDFLQLRLPLCACWHCLWRICCRCVGGHTNRSTHKDKTLYAPDASTVSAPSPKIHSEQHDSCEYKLSGNGPMPGSGSSNTLLQGGCRRKEQSATPFTPIIECTGEADDDLVPEMPLLRTP